MGSWGKGPFDNDDAGEALIALVACQSEHEFVTTLLNSFEFHHSDDFDDEHEYSAVASSAVLCLLLENSDFETQQSDFVEENPVRLLLPSDFQSIKDKFSNADLKPLIPKALEALLAVSSSGSFTFALRDGDADWLKNLNQLRLRLRKCA